MVKLGLKLVRSFWMSPNSTSHPLKEPRGLRITKNTLHSYITNQATLVGDILWYAYRIGNSKVWLTHARRRTDICEVWNSIYDNYYRYLNMDIKSLPYTQKESDKFEHVAFRVLSLQDCSSNSYQGAVQVVGVPNPRTHDNRETWHGWICSYSIVMYT